MAEVNPVVEKAQGDCGLFCSWGEHSADAQRHSLLRSQTEMISRAEFSPSAMVVVATVDCFNFMSKFLKVGCGARREAGSVHVLR